MSEPAKTPDLEAMIRRVMREEIDRLEARLRGRRVDGKRRLRAPEASAAAARAIAPAPSPVAAKAAERALRRIRSKVG